MSDASDRVVQSEHEHQKLEESIWSKISREAQLLSDSSATGITKSIQAIEQNPGKAILAAGTGVAMSAPLIMLSSRYRFLQPVLEVAGIAGVACFASDVSSKIGSIGRAVGNYWDHSERKEQAGAQVADSVGTLFVDSIAAGAGLWAGSRLTKKLLEPVGEVGQYHARRLDRLKAKLIPRKPERECLDIINLSDEDTYWANRAMESEKSGFVGTKKSMETLLNSLPEANGRENELVGSFFSKAKDLVPGTKLRYVERTNAHGDPGLRIGVKLPEGISMLGDEAFTLDNLAGKLSEVHNYRVSTDMTPIVGNGKLLKVKTILSEDLSEDALVAISASKKWFKLPFGLGKAEK